MLDPNYLVEKSKPLVWAKFNNYTANELKLLEVYLSRINARDPESSCVRFTKKEYCELMGIHPETKTQQLKKYTQKFLGNVITIDLAGGGYEQYSLFTKATCKNDSELGQVVIDLNCNPDLKQVFFEIAEDGYIRYKLRNIISLSSQYSIRLYSLLKDKAYGNYTWTVDIGELRSLLGITAPRYESFKFLNSEILKKCEIEINENTDIRFTYEKITKGRLTRAIKFSIKQLDENNLPGQMNICDYPEFLPDETNEEPNADPMMKTYEFLSGACDDEFSIEQIKELSRLANDHVEFTFNRDELDLSKFDYIRKKYLALNAKPQETIHSRYGLLKHLVENDN